MKEAYLRELVNSLSQNIKVTFGELGVHTIEDKEYIIHSLAGRGFGIVSDGHNLTVTEPEDLDLSVVTAEDARRLSNLVGGLSPSELAVEKVLSIVKLAALSGDGSVLVRYDDIDVIFPETKKDILSFMIRSGFTVSPLSYGMCLDW